MAALEDGSYAVDGERDTDCQVHVEATPLGTVTTITICTVPTCPDPMTDGRLLTCEPRRRDFFGAAMLFIVLIALVAVIVIGNIPAA